MSLPKGEHVRNAHYHAIKATQTWEALAKAEQARRKRSAGQDKARDEQRERETTYARGEPGYH